MTEVFPTEIINNILKEETNVSEDRRGDLLQSMRKVHAFYDLLHTERLRDSYVIEDPERREEAKKDVRFIDKLCRRLEADIVKEEMNVKSHARETATLKYVKKDELHN